MGAARWGPSIGALQEPRGWGTAERPQVRSGVRAQGWPTSASQLEWTREVVRSSASAMSCRHTSSEGSTPARTPIPSAPRPPRPSATRTPRLPPLIARTHPPPTHLPPSPPTSPHLPTPPPPAEPTRRSGKTRTHGARSGTRIGASGAVRCGRSRLLGVPSGSGPAGGRRAGSAR